MTGRLRWPAGLLAAVVGCATPEYRSARVERNPSFGGGQIIMGPSEVRGLAAAFPGVGTGRRRDMEMGDKPYCMVLFTRDDGRVDVVSTSGRCDRATFDAIVAGRFASPAPSPLMGK